MRGPFLVVFLLCWCFCLRVCGCLSVAVVRLSVGGWVSVSVLCLAVVGSPPLPFVASLPPAVGPLWRPGPVFTLVPPSGYLVAFVTAWLPCLTAGGVVCSVVLTSFCLMAAKAFGPVWGLFYPLHHVACVVRVLSITTLRYSSVMIQVPHWTPLSYTFAILGSKCGILRPCPLLPSRCPLSLSCCCCVLVFCSLVPSVSSCNLPCPHLGA